MDSTKKRSFLLILAVSILTAGCLPVAQIYNGNVFRDAKPYSLAVSKATQVDIETFEFKSSFSYETDGTALSISGTAAMGTHYQLMYGRIRVFDLFLFFLDDNNYVIDGTRLYNAVNADTTGKFPFEQEVMIPAGATQIALGYETSFYSTDTDGGSGGGDWVYLLPLRR